MLWEDFLLSTVRPYPADWMIVGGWGCLNYLIRLDEDLRPFLVLGQNGGLHVEEEDEEGYADGDDGGSDEESTGGFEPEGLPFTGDSLGELEEALGDEELGRLRPRSRHDENVRRLRQGNLRRLNPPVRWRT